MKLLRMITFMLPAIVFLVGCGAGREKPVSIHPIQIDLNEQRIVRATVMSQLKDPYSAIFGGYSAWLVTMKDNRREKVICGLVNAKNSFGGYVGDKQYIAVSPSVYSSSYRVRIGLPYCYFDYGITP